MARLRQGPSPNLRADPCLPAGRPRRPPAADSLGMTILIGLSADPCLRQAGNRRLQI